MDVADAAMEKQRVLSELVQEMNATPSAVDLGKEKGTIPTPLQVFWAIVNSLPRLPAIPTISRPPTAVIEVSEEVTVAPAEAEEVTSPQREIVPLYYE